MTKPPRKTAIFTFDRRGWPNLYRHVSKQLDKGQLDKELHELQLTGTRIKTTSDEAHFAKTLSLFSGIKTIVVKDMGLRNLDFLGEMLCTRFMTTKLVDISCNSSLPRETITAFIDILQGRSHTKEVPPIWLAIGNVPELFTENFDCCNPHVYGGCVCKQNELFTLVRTCTL